MDSQKIKKIYNQINSLHGGKVADYIPQLKEVNPDLFGISICTVNGKKINIGDSEYRFCLQSCSKPLSYCIAHQLYGKESTHKHVGYEPSGHEFNAFILNKKGLPHNPMINAGAIMVASQIGKGLEPSERFNIIKEYYNKMVGVENEVGFDNSIFLSEKHHADRNISLAYYMRENGAFKEEITPNQITESLDLYFQQCSITINCQMGAIMAATLANGGICPVTSEKIFDKSVIEDCLTLMYGCGMYDYSGQFAFEVGLPAKSGVSGCILLVVPNKMGICIWSPPLDDNGNSYKGIEFCKQLSIDLNLHIFHNLVLNKIEYDNDENINQKFITLCSKGDIENITKILSLVNINTSDYDKRTGLHLATAEGHLDTVELLLSKNADLTKDRWGNTPFSEILNKEGDNFDSIKKLLSDKPIVSHSPFSESSVE
jgi:glutaminase